MILKNRLLKFSSLCIVGAVTFTVVKFTPAVSKSKANEEILNGAQQSKSLDLEDEDSSAIVIADILSDKNAQNAINLSVEGLKDDEFKASLPELAGIGKLYFSRKDYANFVIATQDLKITDEPNEDAKVVGRLHQNCGGFIVEDGKDWCKIKSGRVEGYVQSKFLIRGEKAIAIIQKEGKYYAVAKDNLSVKKEPKANAEELYKLSKGEAMIAKEVMGDWIKVQSILSDSDAYVLMNEVSIQYQLAQAEKEEEAPYYSVGVSTKRSQIMELAKSNIGVPYVWGGQALGSGVDCSGFVRQVYMRKAGITLPRTAAEQSRCGRSVSESELKPGDLVFYREGSKVTHVGFYYGNGKLLHAPQPGERVKVGNMNYSSNRFYRRILDD